MVYSDDDDYGKHRGYDDFADFVDNETIPTDAGLEEIRKEANAIVNVAFHESEDDATTFTTILKEYEMRVMDRKILKNKWLEKLENPSPIPFLTLEEFLYLRDLGEEDHSVFTIQRQNFDSPYSGKYNRWFY